MYLQGKNPNLKVHNHYYYMILFIYVYHTGEILNKNKKKKI